MVSIEYIRKGKAFCLTLSGHAGAAPKGMDLVCSAVSALVHTAAQCALDHYTDGELTEFPMVELKPGAAQVAAVAQPSYLEKVEQTFETVMTGCKLLQQQYPQFVTVKISNPQ